ncbi:MAG: ParB/RepB/Spo0J family partition protein [Bdellovibrionaceae bacterium]|nr:ParB/RepB/Spo0J family partition protein [Pseudobdellovibrionaceae bacterium]
MSELSNDSSNKKKPLGRGLGSLLGGPAPSSPVLERTPAPAAAKPQMSTPAPAPTISPEARIWQVSVDKLRPSAYQPRGVFEKDKLQELSTSIKASGILQPIVARKLPNGSFEIIAGERRWRAAQMAGLHEVPVILKTLGDRETLEMALVENIQREDLNPIEEADAYQRLAQEFNLTQQQVAEKVGKDRATVANAIRLLQLPEQVRDMVTRQEISVGHAKVLLSLQSPSEMTKWAKKAAGEALTVRKLEKAVQETLAPKKAAASSLDTTNVTERLISGLSDELQKLLGTKVNIDYQNSKGKISIHFYSDDELSQLIDKVREGCRKS